MKALSIVLTCIIGMTLIACTALIYGGTPGDIAVSDKEYQDYKAAKEYEEEYGKPDFGGRSPDLPICECDPCRCKDCECHLGVNPNPQINCKCDPCLCEDCDCHLRRKGASMPKMPSRKPQVDSVPAKGLFSGRESTTIRQSKMWLTIRTYINSDGIEDPWCDVWIVKRDGAVLQGLLHGHILQEHAEQLIASSSLPVKYEVLDFSPKRDSIDRPINPQPFEDLDELDE